MVCSIKKGNLIGNLTFLAMNAIALLSCAFFDCSILKDVKILDIKR